MDIFEIRRRNLALLIDDLERRGVTRNMDQAQQLGALGSSYLSQLKGGKKIGEDTARKIEAARGLATGWMDMPQWEGAPDSHSQALRLNKSIVASVARTLLDTYAAEGMTYDFTQEWELFVDLYDAAVRGELRPTGGQVKVGRWIERKSPQGADSGTGKAGVPTPGTHTGNKGVRRKA
jgi:hypothetical protein